MTFFLGRAAPLLVLSALGLCVTACGEAGQVSAPATGPVPTSATSSPATVPKSDRSPALFPEARTPELPVGEQLETESGASVGLEVRVGSDASGDSVEEQVQLVVNQGGERLAAPVPAGWAPTLVAVPIQLGQAGVGYLVKQEGGDSTTLSLYVRSGSQLVVATPASEVPFGGGFAEETSQAYRTWVGPRGSVLTTGVSPMFDASTVRVFTWEVSGPRKGAAQTGAPRVELVPTDHGTFCQDRRGAIREC
ncbi:MAG: hypothetical protein WB767_17270 [Nocardioides sp.]